MKNNLLFPRKAIFIILVLFTTLLISNESYAQNCAVNSGAPQGYCTPVTEMELQGATSGFNVIFPTLSWSVISVPAGANVTITNPLNLATTVTGTFVPGPYTFRISSDCSVGTTFQDVTHTVHPPSTVANIPNFQNVGCYLGDSILLSPPSGSSIPGVNEIALWTVPLTSSGIIVAGESTTNSAYLKPIFDPKDCKSGSNSYTVKVRYTIRNTVTGCSDYDEMFVNMTYLPGTVYATAIPLRRCGRTVDLYGACSGNGTGLWSLDYTSTPGATATYTNGGTDPYANVTVTDTGYYVFKWDVSGGCRPGTGLTDTVYFYDCKGPCDSIFPVSAGEDRWICSPIPGSVALDALAMPPGYTGKWTQLDGYAVTIQDDSDPKSLISGLQPGGGPYLFSWEVDGPSCTHYDTIVIHERPNSPMTVTDRSFCTLNEDASFAWTGFDMPYPGNDTFSVKVTLVEAPDSFKVFNLEPEFTIWSGNAYLDKAFYHKGFEYYHTTDYYFGGRSADTILKVGDSGHLNWGVNMGRDNLFWDNYNLPVTRFQVLMGSAIDKEGPVTPGSYKWLVETYNGCVSNSYEVTWNISSNTSGISANAGTDLVVPCGEDSVQLAGNNLGLTEALWSYVSGPGPNPFYNASDDEQFVTVYNLNDGLHTFRYQEVNTVTGGGNDCLNESDEVTVLIATGSPTAVQASTDADTICGGGSVHLYGDPGTAAQGTWTIEQGNATGVSFYPSDSALNVTAIGLSANQLYTFRFTAENLCDTASATTSVFVNNATAGDPAIVMPDICYPAVFPTKDTATLYSAIPITNGIVQWNLINPTSPGTLVISDPMNDTTFVDNLKFGINEIELTVSSTDPGCPYVSRDTIEIVNNFPVSFFTGSKSFKYCNAPLPYTQSFVATPQTSSIYNYTNGSWKLISGPAPVSFGPKADTTEVDITFTAFGTYTLRYGLDVKGDCPSTMYEDIFVTIGDIIFTAFAGVDDSMCNGNGLFTMDALDIPGTSNSVGEWNVQESNGASATITNPSDPNTTVQVTGNGNVVLRWKVSNPGSGCPPNYDDVILYNGEKPDAGTDITTCDASAVNLVATPAMQVGTMTWSKASGPAGDNIISPNTNATTVTGLLPASTYEYVYTTDYANCTLSDTVVVNLVSIAGAPTITADTLQCAADGLNVALTGNVPASGVNVEWTLTSYPVGLAGESFNDTNMTSTSFTATTLPAGDYYFTYRWYNGSCEKTSFQKITLEPCGTIGNYVWTDSNSNGTNDELATAGINGVLIKLYKETAPASGVYAVVDSMQTANDGSGNPGYYLFGIDESANYYVEFPTTTDNANALTTQTATAATDNNSDADPSTGASPVFSMDLNGTGVDKDNLTIDAAYKVSSPNVLGDHVWNDLNNDGIQDANEVGVAGITVTLSDNTGNPIATTVTDAYGNYLFTDLPDGDYAVGFTLPPNYIFSPQDAGTNDSTDSDVNPSTGKTVAYTLMGGDSVLTADAGIYFAPATAGVNVGDYVWYDTNLDGIQDSSEVGVSGVTVTLYDNAGNPVATTITDGDGGYLFTDVPPGNYTVGFTPPAGLTFSPTGSGTAGTDSDPSPSTGQTGTFAVGTTDVLDIDAGLIPLPTTVGSLGDRVWYDENQDGIQDAGEVGVQGATVTLYDSTGTNVLATTETDAFGNYIFPNLNAGKYVVGFTTPAGYTISPQGAGSDTTLNSDANTTSGLTSVITLAQGEHNPTIDAGIFNSTPANNNSIGDYVWHDENQDGIQDANEEGVGGVTVTLYDNTGSPIGTTTTDPSGHYTFPFLPNGTYSVGFSNLPADFVLSPTGAGTTATDSDPNPSTGRTSTVSLTGNTHITDLDAGIYKGDMNIGTASLGDKVWYDVDGDGVQDPDELGVAGVTAYLYDSTGTNIVDSTTTDALGNYIFTGLTPDTYYVGFANTPTGFTFSPQDADSEGTNGPSNSDVNPSTGLSNPIVLGAGEDNLNIDAGIVPPAGTAGLGDKVWIDLNQDGLQDANEPGVPGVQVSLLDENGNVVSVTTTDKNGNYQFIGLTPANYQVQFSNLPAGYTLTTQDADNNGLAGTSNSDADTTTGLTSIITLAANEYNPNIDAGIKSSTVASVGDYVWNDENGDGIQDPNEVGVGGVLVTLYDNVGNPVASTLTNEDGSYLFPNVIPGAYTMGFDNLPSGMTFTGQDAGTNDSTDSDVDPITGRTATFNVTAGSHNPTIDAGLITPLPAGLGNYVWHDFNEDGVQDAGEPGVAGVLVTLYAADGTTEIAQAVTNGDGYYEFTNLAAGDYVVGFSSLPDGSTPTQSNGGINTVDNSDMDPDSQKTAVVTLISGEFNPNVDAGIYYGVPLPVAFGDFSLTKSVCDVSLNWNTLSESNTSHFNVLRSLDSAPFEIIGRVDAAGNSNIKQTYTFEDAQLDGRYYYKIQIIDVDGQQTISKTIGVNVNCSSNELIRLYPNPVSDNLFIQSNLNEDDFFTIRLLDITGSVVYESKHNVAKGGDNFKVPMRSLASGSYMLEINAELSGNFFYKIQKK